MDATALMVVPRLAPQRSLPPCGGGTGWGVVTNSEPVGTLLPTPPPQGGREQAVPRGTAMPHFGGRK
jgi:hypothetical protein